MSTLAKTGEYEAIRRLTSKLGTHPDLKVATGDDCAVATLPGSDFDQVFTTDPVVEGVHFLSNEVPERIGRKAVGRVLSDLAAMGAKPQWILVNVIASPEQDVQVLERIYGGLVASCQRFGATVIGGDLAQGPVLELHVFGTGLVPKGSALLRSGARPGDAIFVTAPLGCSIGGKHLDFIPRVEEGMFLRESGMVNSMMDISDGLATDLRHILEQSHVGALLDAARIPVNGTLENALYDGEDFELLFTAPVEQADALQESWRQRFDSSLFQIGRVLHEPNTLKLQRGDGTIEQLGKMAFEHFTQSNSA